MVNSEWIPKMDTNYGRTESDWPLANHNALNGKKQCRCIVAVARADSNTSWLRHEWWIWWHGGKPEKLNVSSRYCSAIHQHEYSMSVSSHTISSARNRNPHRVS